MWIRIRQLQKKIQIFFFQLCWQALNQDPCLYDPAVVLSQFPYNHLYEERAILLGMYVFYYSDFGSSLVSMSRSGYSLCLCIVVQFCTGMHCIYISFSINMGSRRLREEPDTPRSECRA
jgi:hypothetical protein